MGTAIMSILFYLIIASIIAGIIGYILGNRKLSYYKELYEERDRSYRKMKGEYDKALAKRDELQKSNSTISRKYDDLVARFEAYKREKADTEKTITELRYVNENLEGQINDMANYKGQYENAVIQMQETDKAMLEMKAEYDKVSSMGGASAQELEEAINKNFQLQQDFAKISGDYRELNRTYDEVAKLKLDQAREYEVVKRDKAFFKEELEKLKLEYEKLKNSGSTADNELKNQVEQYTMKIQVLEEENGRFSENIKSLQAENESLKNASASVNQDLMNELEGLKTKNSECADTVASLKAKLAASDSTPKEPISKKEETLQRIKAKAEKINFGRIGVASADDKDDLKEIKGIGPFLEEKLNTLGIYKFKQIANFTEEDEETVNDAIEFFPGRIKRDNWKSQAYDFAKAKGDL